MDLHQVQTMEILCRAQLHSAHLWETSTKGGVRPCQWFYKTTHLSVCHVHTMGSRSNLRSHLMGIHISPHQWGTTGSPKWWQKGIRKRDFMLLPPECHPTCSFSCASCHLRPSGLYKCHSLVCVQRVKGTVVFTHPPHTLLCIPPHESSVPEHWTQVARHLPFPGPTQAPSHPWRSAVYLFL